MARFLPIAAAFGMAMLAGCASHTNRVACNDRVAAMMASNDAAIRAHKYTQASRTAETAARLSMHCDDRWRAANAFKVAAELAHQNGDTVRAQVLLHQSFSLMRGLRKTVKWNDITATLLAQRLDSARKEMNGQWAYW